MSKLVTLLEKNDYDITEEVENYLESSPLWQIGNWFADDILVATSNSDLEDYYRQSELDISELEMLEGKVYTFNYKRLADKFGVDEEEVIIFLNYMFTDTRVCCDPSKGDKVFVIQRGGESNIVCCEPRMGRVTSVSVCQ